MAQLGEKSDFDYRHCEQNTELGCYLALWEQVNEEFIIEFMSAVQP